MKINIASLDICTFHAVPYDIPFPEPVEPPDRKEENEQTFDDYLNIKFEEMKKTLINGLLAALDRNKNSGAECLFFTLPEFFWNISPYAIWHEEELTAIGEFHKSKVKDFLETLILEYPEHEFGKIILLPGTSASLEKIASDDTESNIYNSYNYVYCVDNFSNSGNEVSVSSWPKTNVAGYDYGYTMTGGNPLRFKVGKPGKTFMVDVKDKSDKKAFHLNPSDSVFFNDILIDVPFMISLCADYHEDADFRMDELRIASPKLHFLLACAMTLNGKKKYPLSVQFTYRNDGFAIGNIWQPIRGASEIKPVVNGEIVGTTELAIDITDRNNDFHKQLNELKNNNEDYLSFYSIEVS